MAGIGIGPPQVIQIILVTVVFVFHLFTFYDLSILWNSDMIVLETTVYGIYFVIMMGYIVAAVSDGNFVAPLEAMTKLYGAILFNVLGLMTFRVYSEEIANHGVQNVNHIFGLMKSVCSIVVCILFYVEMFQA